MHITEDIAADAALIARRIAAYPFKPYRHYRVYSRQAQLRILAAEVDEVLGSVPPLCVAAADDRSETLVVARALGWDSQFFGVPMARIDYILSSGGPEDRATIGAAVDACLAKCRAAGLWHVSARLDVEDIGAVEALQRLGFRLMDALVTYRMRPKKETPVEVRDVGRIRDYVDDDAEQVLDVAREAFAGYVGRFQHDPHIPPDRAAEFYLEWTRTCIAGRMVDKRLVSVGADGRIIGYLFFRRREPASSVGGVPILGGGIGACRRSAPGAYAGLIRVATVWSHDQGGIGEYQTQNYNFPVIRVYEAAGAGYVRGEYSLHAWIGPEPRGT